MFDFLSPTDTEEWDEENGENGMSAEPKMNGNGGPKMTDLSKVKYENRSGIKIIIIGDVPFLKNITTERT